MRTPVFTCAVIALAGAIGVLGAQAKDVAFVVSVNGPWQIGSQPVRVGDRLAGGGRVSLGASADFRPNSSYDITVWQIDDVKVARHCYSRASCDAAAWTLPASIGTPSSLLARFVDAFNRLRGHEERYTATQARALAAPVLADAVVEAARGQLAIRPLFTAIAPGRYVLVFRSPDASAAEIRMNVDWRAGSPNPQMPSALRPGLYVVALLRADPPQDQFGDDAWWLVQPTNTYAPASKAFADAVAASDAWQRDATPADVSAFRRAYLEALAR